MVSNSSEIPGDGTCAYVTDGNLYSSSLSIEKYANGQYKTCPEGWRLPSWTEVGKIQAINSTYFSGSGGGYITGQGVCYNSMYFRHAGGGWFVNGSASQTETYSPHRMPVRCIRDY